MPLYYIYVIYTIWKFIASQGIEMPFSLWNSCKNPRLWAYFYFLSLEMQHNHTLFSNFVICILICRYYIVNFDIKQFQSAAVSYYRCSCIDRAYSKVARREIKISVLKMCFPQRKDEFMHVLTWITHNCQDPKLKTKPNRVMHGYVHIIDAQHHVIRKQ